MMRWSANVFSFALLATVVVTLERSVIPRIYERIPPKNEHYDRMLNGKRIAEDSQQYDVLILGDSTARGGFIPPLFYERTGMTSYNLATFGRIHPFIDPYILERYLQHHPAPQAVLIINSVNFGWRNLEYDTYREYYLDAITIPYLLFRTGHWPPEDMIEASVAFVVPSLRYREHIRRGWDRDPANLRKKPQRWEKADPALSGYKPTLVGGPSRDFRDPSWAFSTDSAAAILLRHTCAMGREHGVPIYFTFSPYDVAYHQEPYLSLVEKKMSAVEQFLAAQQGCHFIPGMRGYSTELMADTTHATHSGAILFTGELADIFLDRNGSGSDLFP